MSMEAVFGIDRLKEVTNFFSIEGNIGSGKTTFKRAIELYVRENNLSALHLTEHVREHVYLLIDEPVAEWTQQVYSRQNCNGEGANGDSNLYSLLDLFYKEMKEKTTPVESKPPHTDGDKEEDAGPKMLDQVALAFQATTFTSRLKNLVNSLSRMPRHPAQTKVHIISERSLLTDRLFFANLNDSGLIPGFQWKAYDDFFNIICGQLLKSHNRIIYLPTSAEKSHERIHRRSRGAEVDNDIPLGYLESLHGAHTQMISKFVKERGTDAVIHVNFEQDLAPPQIDTLVNTLMRDSLHSQ